MNQELKIAFIGFRTTELCDLIDHDLREEHETVQRSSEVLTRDANLFSNPDLIVAIGGLVLTGLQKLVKAVLVACRQKSKYGKTLVRLKNSKGAFFQFPANASMEEIESYMRILEKFEIQEIDLIEQ